MISVEYDYVFRWHGPNYGRRCRVVAFGSINRDVAGSIIHNTGSESIAIEFEGGEKIEAQRQQIVRMDSKIARQVVAKAARGMTKMSVHRRAMEEQSRPIARGGRSA